MGRVERAQCATTVLVKETNKTNWVSLPTFKLALDRVERAQCATIVLVKETYLPTFKIALDRVEIQRGLSLYLLFLSIICIC